MNKESPVRTFLKDLGNLGRSLLSRISKLFDKVIYNQKAALIVSGILSLLFCVSINYSDLSLQFFSDDQTTLKLTGIPVEAYYDSENYEVSGLPSTAELSIVGDPADIQLVRTQNSATVTVNLQGLSDGSYTLVLDPGGIPSDLNATVTPETADITLTRKYTKTFFVTPELIPGPGQKISEFETPVLANKSVSIKATREQLNSIRTVKAIVDASGHEDSFTVEATVVAYDAAGKQINVGITPSVITATVNKASDDDKDAEDSTANTSAAQKSTNTTHSTATEAD